ncbi:kinase-like domain-containing protein [Suillus discolor]|uniref:Kinase-like domain-containing protein n=1 Tax=Suillus discolor TaxID=1912936 RepID=A0A9P7F0V3_9AGAM|nr:kinase-like domain-containing protein [Suillus discolor]KAG2099883.1 kinase-like domain-containing protein [Suillus discolor]
MSTSISSPSEITTDELISEASQQSAHSSSGLLQDLTKELQRSSPFPITCGGFGDIYKCQLVRPDGTIPVAVKTIRALQSDNEALMRKNKKRIRRELKVWGRLKHNSILPLWGVAIDFGPYLAMVCPWADNGTLTGFLERQEDVLTLEDKFTLLTDIALGLQYQSVHSKSIVHGDLTGSNVLIYENGRACVTDFGLSTMIEEFIGTSYLTSSIRGNVRWAAAELYDIPESDEDDSLVSLSVECDIYSFGSIILQVLTCKVPYYDVKKDNAGVGTRRQRKEIRASQGLASCTRALGVHTAVDTASCIQTNAVDDGNSSGKPSGIWPGTWSGGWSGHWSDSDSDEGKDSEESDDGSSSGTDQSVEGESLDGDDDGEYDKEQQGSEGDEHDKRGDEDDEDDKGVDGDEVVGLDGRDGSDDNDSSSGIDQNVEREDFDEDRDDESVEGNEGHEGSEGDENGGDEEEDESSEVVEGDGDDEGDEDINGPDNDIDYDDSDGGADGGWSDDSDVSW